MTLLEGAIAAFKRQFTTRGGHSRSSCNEEPVAALADEPRSSRSRSPSGRRAEAEADMGAQLRVYRRRIKSVQSTKKITKAMELIAASRIVKAQQRVEAALRRTPAS